MEQNFETDPVPGTSATIARPNGEAMAAFLAAGIGSFAVGLFVILNTIGAFSAPALHAGAGGVSGRTTFAVVVWLLAWAVLHYRWRGRHVEPRGVHRLALLLLIAGLIATFPPVWELL
jgi:hypothetical protein